MKNTGKNVLAYLAEESLTKKIEKVLYNFDTRSPKNLINIFVFDIFAIQYILAPPLWFDWEATERQETEICTTCLKKYSKLNRGVILGSQHQYTVSSCKRFNICMCTFIHTMYMDNWASSGAFSKRSVSSLSPSVSEMYLSLLSCFLSIQVSCSAPKTTRRGKYN